jgi:hypothetical protein
LLVEVNRGRGIGDERRRIIRHAAEVDRTAAGRGGVDREARHEAGEILDAAEIGALHRLLADGLDFLRNVEDGFLALACRDDDGVEVGRRRLGQRCRCVVAREGE